MQIFLKKSIQVIFMLLVISLIVCNLFSVRLSIEKILIEVTLLASIILLFSFLYRRKIINNKFIRICLISLLIAGIVIRLLLIFRINITLASDYKLYYDNALGILNGQLPDASYLAYNGYAYNFSSVLALIFFIFGDSVRIALIFNLICQILTFYLLYKVIKDRTNEYIGLFGATFWFLFPNVIFANLLVSTETFFMLLFTLSIYMFFKIFDNKKECKNSIKNKWLTYILLGFLIAATNNFRPVMAIFIIALIILFILKSKKIGEYIAIILIIVSYFLTNSLFNIYVEKGIGMETKSGASGWSIYFGANSKSCGGWTPEDSMYITDVLAHTEDGDKYLIDRAFERYKHLGVSDSLNLFKCKFYNLWTDNISTYHFFIPLLDKNSSIELFKYKEYLNVLGTILFLSLCIATLICSFIEWRRNKFDSIFIQLFTIGYVLANLIVVLNGRYNLPVSLLFIITATPLLLYCKIFKAN